MLLHFNCAVVATLAAVCLIAACGKREEAPAPTAPAPAQQSAPAAEKPSPAPPPAAQPSPPPVPAAPPIGTIDSLEGEVRLTRAGAARAAQAGMALEQGDALQTGAQSWALLAMADGGSVTIRPDTQINIDAYR